MLNRFVPDNLKVINYDDKIRFIDKILGVKNVFKKVFFREILHDRKAYGLNLSAKTFKIAYMDLLRAEKLRKAINDVIKNQSINLTDTIFYSYWHDYKSLALARSTMKYINFKAIARAHGWDVFADRHNPTYLPFKKFIIRSLNMTFSISNAGINELIKINGQDILNKTCLSRLGVENNRVLNHTKNERRSIICSCGNMLPIKRINKIIDVLSKLENTQICWVHFGYGVQKDELERYAANHLKRNKFSFRGLVANNEILDFYSENYVDLFINLSESEGIPVSIMEALSAGIPVLATDVGGTSEAVNDQIGFLVDKDFNVENVAAIVSAYLNSSMENQIEYRKRAHKFWEDNYNAEKNYEEFANQIISLM